MSAGVARAESCSVLSRLFFVCFTEGKSSFAHSLIVFKLYLCASIFNFLLRLRAAGSRKLFAPNYLPFYHSRSLQKLKTKQRESSRKRFPLSAPFWFYLKMTKWLVGSICFFPLSWSWWELFWNAISSPGATCFSLGFSGTSDVSLSVLFFARIKWN